MFPHHSQRSQVSSPKVALCMSKVKVPSVVNDSVSDKVTYRLSCSGQLKTLHVAQVCLETKKPMRPGKLFTLELKFEYNLTDSLVGFYLSTYKVLMVYLSIRKICHK